MEKNEEQKKLSLQIEGSQWNLSRQNLVNFWNIKYTGKILKGSTEKRDLTF